MNNLVNSIGQLTIPNSQKKIKNSELNNGKNPFLSDRGCSKGKVPPGMRGLFLYINSYIH